MARKAGRAGVRFHELQRAEAGSHAGARQDHRPQGAAEDDQAPLRRYASGMAKVAAADRRILSEAKETKEAMQELAEESRGGGKQAAALLGRAEEEQHKLLAEERRDVIEARRRLGPRGLGAGCSKDAVKFEAGKLRTRARRAHEVLKRQAKFVAGEAELARRCKHLLSELSEVH